MALSIPIISEFDGKGIDKAIKEFKQLETAGEKAHFLIEKAAIPAAAALAGVTTALTFAVKAAMEDELAQTKLAQTLENTVGATEAQIKATEDMISAMSRATGTADDELRPAFAALVLGSHDIAKATDALAISQDIATSTGKSLAEVSSAMSLGFGGNMRALAALSPELKVMIKEGATLDTVMSILADNFGGATAAAANTAAGKFKIMKNSISETKESIGAALLPAVAAVLPYLQKMADWAQNNPKLFLYVAGTIAAVSTAILALNFAMSLNPVVALTAGIIALAAAMIYLEKRTNALSDSWGRFGAVIRLVLGPLYDVFALAAKLGLVDKISLPSFTPSTSTGVSTLPSTNQFSSGPVAVGSGMAREGGTGNIVIPTMPAPGAPLSGGGGSSGGGSGGGGGGAGGGNLFSPAGGGTVNAFTPFGVAERIAARGDTITVNVNGGISTSAQIGQAVYNSLIQYKQQVGTLTALAV